jgi:hypothetical protein
MAGITLNDRKLAADVRTLSLKEMKKVLEGNDEDFKKQLILKLASSALPRLNEITGEDGDPIVVQMVNYANSTNPS